MKTATLAIALDSCALPGCASTGGWIIGGGSACHGYANGEKGIDAAQGQ